MAPFCQSCGMPVSGEAGWGTESDGTRSADYCIECYKNGEFAEPRLTMEQMVERVGTRMRALNFPTEMIALNAKLIPTFKRWKQELLG